MWWNAVLDLAFSLTLGCIGVGLGMLIWVAWALLSPPLFALRRPQPLALARPALQALQRQIGALDLQEAQSRDQTARVRLREERARLWARMVRFDQQSRPQQRRYHHLCRQRIRNWERQKRIQRLWSTVPLLRFLSRAGYDKRCLRRRWVATRRIETRLAAEMSREGTRYRAWEQVSLRNMHRQGVFALWPQEAHPSPADLSAARSSHGGPDERAYLAHPSRLPVLRPRRVA